MNSLIFSNFNSLEDVDMYYRSLFIRTILVIVVLGIIFFFLDRLLRKWLKVEKSGFFEVLFVNRIHKWGSIIIAVIAIIFILVNASSSYPINLIYFIVPIFIVQQGFHAFMQWKYPNRPREYVITLIFIGIYIVCIWVIINFKVPLL